MRAERNARIRSLYGEGLSYKEICTRVEVTLGMVQAALREQRPPGGRAAVLAEETTRRHFPYNAPPDPEHAKLLRAGIAEFRALLEAKAPSRLRSARDVVYRRSAPDADTDPRRPTPSAPALAPPPIQSVLSSLAPGA